jgi:hypothetical protein
MTRLPFHIVIIETKDLQKNCMICNFVLTTFTVLKYYILSFKYVDYMRFNARNYFKVEQTIH